MKIKIKKKAFYGEMEKIRSREDEELNEKIIDYFKNIKIPDPFKISYIEDDGEEPKLYNINNGMDIYEFFVENFGIWTFFSDEPQRAIEENIYSLDLWMEVLKEYNEEPPYIEILDRHIIEAKKKIKRTAQDEELTVAQTILHQLGGNKFRAMTGAHSFASHGDALSFKLPGKNFAKDGINYVKITLDLSDTYTIEFGKIRGATYKIIHKISGIYADQLQTIFKEKTGLDTHL